MRHGSWLVLVLFLVFLSAPFIRAQQQLNTPDEGFGAKTLRNARAGERLAPGQQIALASGVSALSQDQKPCFIRIELPHNGLYFHVAKPGTVNDNSLSASVPVTISSSHRQRLVIRARDPKADVESLGIASSGLQRPGSVKPTEKGTTLKVRWYAKTQLEYPDWTLGEPITVIRDGDAFDGVSWALSSSLPGEAQCEIKCELVPDKYQIDGHYSSGEIVIDFVPIL